MVRTICHFELYQLKVNVGMSRVVLADSSKVNPSCYFSLIINPITGPLTSSRARTYHIPHYKANQFTFTIHTERPRAFSNVGKIRGSYTRYMMHRNISYFYHNYFIVCFFYFFFSVSFTTPRKLQKIQHLPDFTDIPRVAHHFLINQRADSRIC